MTPLLILAAAVAVAKPEICPTNTICRTLEIISSDRGKVITATDPSKGVWSYGPLKPSDVGKCLISPAYPLYWSIGKCP